MESVTDLPDGSREIVVSARVILPDGTHVKSVDMGKRLEEAARVECGGAFELITSDKIGLETPKSGGLKSTLKGSVRCSGSTH